jgi:hypothetical protein
LRKISLTWGRGSLSSVSSVPWTSKKMFISSYTLR